MSARRAAAPVPAFAAARPGAWTPRAAWGVRSLPGVGTPLGIGPPFDGGGR